jgi:hypothetical protein
VPGPEARSSDLEHLDQSTQVTDKRLSPSPIVAPVALSLVLAPNPANDRAFAVMNLPEPANLTLSIYNILGERVSSLTMGRQEAGQSTAVLDLGDLSSGIYLAVLETEDDFGNVSHQTFKLAVEK